MVFLVIKEKTWVAGGNLMLGSGELKPSCSGSEPGQIWVWLSLLRCCPWATCLGPHLCSALVLVFLSCGASSGSVCGKAWVS